MSETLALIVPSYNEEGSISTLLSKWQGVLNELNIDYVIKVYDASKDSTPNILRQAAEKDSRIVPVFCPKIGHGPTLALAYKENMQYTWVFQIDSDDEMDHEAFARLWQERKNYDILLGSRDQRKSGVIRWTISFMSRFLVRVFYGRGVYDVNAPYRLMRTSALKPFATALPNDAFAPNVLMSGWVAANKLRIFQIPVLHTERRTGVMISKWQLLKCSLIPFWQTIKFSFTSRKNNAS